MRLIPNVNTKNCSKCPVCIEAKFVKKLFKSVTTRKIELLEIVHSDLADFKNTMSKGGTKGYVTFVDDTLGIPKFTFSSLKMRLRKCS